MNTTVLMGPPAPRIAFWAGKHYLGTTRAVPSQVQAARAAISLRIRKNAQGIEFEREQRLLSTAIAVLECGFVTQELH